MSGKRDQPDEDDFEARKWAQRVATTLRHELRNHVAATQMSLELARDQLSDGDLTLRYVNRAEKSLRRIMRLIDEAQEVAEPDAPDAPVPSQERLDAPEGSASKGADAPKRSDASKGADSPKRSDNDAD